MAKAKAKPTAKATSGKREHLALKRLSKICLELPEVARRAMDWSEVRNLVELSYALVAPKRLSRVR